MTLASVGEGQRLMSPTTSSFSSMTVTRRRLAAAPGRQLGSACADPAPKLKERHLLAGVQAERGQRSQGAGPVPQTDEPDCAVQRIGLGSPSLASRLTGK
jgi:hypothetical protein